MTKTIEGLKILHQEKKSHLMENENGRPLLQEHDHLGDDGATEGEDHQALDDEEPPGLQPVPGRFQNER